MTNEVIVGFSTTDKLMSRIIRWITRGKSSHAWLRYWDDTLQLHMVLQAELHGYETIPWDKWKSKNRLIAAFEPNGKNITNGVRFIAKSLGADYDFRSAVWTGLKRWFRKKSKRALHSPKKLMCSEAVVRALQHSGIECVANFDPETTSPVEIYTALNNSQEFILKDLGDA